MLRPREQTQTSDFSEFGVMNLPRQTRLPQDDQSSFSSLDSDIANAHYNSTKPASSAITPKQSARKYHYLDGESSFRGTVKTPRTFEQGQQSKLLSKSPQPNRSEIRFSQKPHTNCNTPTHIYIPPLIQQPRPLPSFRPPPPAPASHHQLQSLLVQNQTYRHQLQLLRSSNQTIQQQLRLNHEQIRKLRLQVAQSAHRVHDSYIRHEAVDRELTERLKETEIELRELRTQLAQSEKRVIHQRNRSGNLHKETVLLRDKLASFERQLYEINIKEDQLKHSYAEVEEGHIRKIAQLEKQLQHKKSEPETKWQDNFIDVLIDMVHKISSRQGIRLQPDLPRKKKAKECWKYLKKTVLGRCRREEPSSGRVQGLRD